MNNISSLPYEKRIRVKWFIFGMLLSFTVVCISVLLGGIVGYTFQYFYPNIGWLVKPEFYINQMVGGGAMIIPIGWFTYWLYNTKQRNKITNEVIGLKWDWLNS